MTDTAPPELRAFVREYERRTNTHDFEAVRELIHPDAMYWFSDGTHEGIDEIERAFERTWEAIQHEVYKIEDVRWLTVEDTSAAYVYTFRWEGTVDGQVRSGGGRGTTVLVRWEGAWKAVHEHLSV